MSFLAENMIKSRIEEILSQADDRSYATNPNNKALQPSSLELRLGKEVYLSGEKKVVRLKQSSPHVHIRPGDFAILLTKEKICIPNNLMGFISIKRRFKDMGLVNISGFHVDPGFTGHLTFSVYNAGPSDILLRFEEHIFILFFSEIVGNASGYHGGYGKDHIPIESINKLTGKSVSPFDLDKRLGTLETRVTIQWGLLAAIMVGVFTLAIKVLASSN